ncbi:hypothetical protein SUDANB140_07072 [Streptomyces sp. enrichment culture]
MRRLYGGRYSADPAPVPPPAPVPAVAARPGPPAGPTGGRA